MWINKHYMRGIWTKRIPFPFNVPAACFPLAGGKDQSDRGVAGLVGGTLHRERGFCCGVLALYWERNFEENSPPPPPPKSWVEVLHKSSPLAVSVCRRLMGRLEEGHVKEGNRHFADSDCIKDSWLTSCYTERSINNTEFWAPVPPTLSARRGAN